MAKLSRVVALTLIVIIVYISVEKLFPEKKDRSDMKKDLAYIEKNLRGGDFVKNSLIYKIIHNKIVQNIITQRALKIGIIVAYSMAIQYEFHDEIRNLLLDEAFKSICVKKVDGQLKLVCNVINENQLHLTPIRSLQEGMVAGLGYDAQLNLLKIKLDFLINGEYGGDYGGRKKFLIISLIALIWSFLVSGTVGLAMFLDAFFQLFQEGRISRALYEEIAEIIKKTWWRYHKVPIEHFL